MATDQRYAVHFYSILSIIIFAYVLWQYTCAWGWGGELGGIRI